MYKLVEDIEIGDKVLHENKELLIVDIYTANGEGLGFICTELSKGKEFKFSKSCGTRLELVTE